MYGYSLEPDGSIGDEQVRYELPVDKVQGCLALTGEPSSFLLSTSYGTASSALWAWTPGSPAEVVLTLPAGLEDLDLGVDGWLWMWSESGARHFQKRFIPWSELYPFVFAIETSEIQP